MPGTESYCSSLPQRGFVVSCLVEVLPIVVLTLTIPIVHADDIVDIGEYVVVEGAITGCEDFPGILTSLEVQENSKLQLFGLPAIDVIGETTNHIVRVLIEQIVTARIDKKPPNSLSVRVLSRSEYEKLSGRDLSSALYLRHDMCSKFPREQTPTQKFFDRVNPTDWSTLAIHRPNSFD